MYIYIYIYIYTNLHTNTNPASLTSLFMLLIGSSPMPTQLLLLATLLPPLELQSLLRFWFHILLIEPSLYPLLIKCIFKTSNLKNNFKIIQVHIRRTVSETPIEESIINLVINWYSSDNSMILSQRTYRLDIIFWRCTIQYIKKSQFFGFF